MGRSAIDRWRTFVEASRGDPDLLTGAFEIARFQYPDLDDGPYRARLGSWAAAAGKRAAGVEDVRGRLSAVREYFVHELRFGPDHRDYGDPRNSFLNDVMDRREGLPITLTIIFCEVARGAGLPAVGVSMPSRFIAALEPPGSDRLLVDVFAGAAEVTETRCRRIVESHMGTGFPFDPAEHLRAASGRETLVRMFANLKGRFLQDGEWERAIEMVDAILLLSPTSVIEYRDRGLARDRAGDIAGALADLRRYRESVPDAPDADGVDSRIRRLEIIGNR